MRMFEVTEGPIILDPYIQILLARSFPETKSVFLYVFFVVKRQESEAREI